MKYDIIYADPPWKYAGSSFNERFPEHHYQTMTTEDICSLSVSDIASERSALLMWATFPKLKDAFKVIDAWGYEYKTVAFVWVKLNKKAATPFWGMGAYTRSNTEVCLLGVRKQRLPVQCHKVHQVIQSPIGRHSEKPNIARSRIEQLFGEVPRVELFARNKTPGWHVWGNEVRSDIALK